MHTVCVIRLLLIPFQLSLLRFVLVLMLVRLNIVIIVIIITNARTSTDTDQSSPNNIGTSTTASTAAIPTTNFRTIINGIAASIFSACRPRSN